jgi:hypothetical protein
LIDVGVIYTGVVATAISPPATASSVVRSPPIL